LFGFDENGVVVVSEKKACIGDLLCVLLRRDSALHPKFCRINCSFKRHVTSTQTQHHEVAQIVYQVPNDVAESLPSPRCQDPQIMAADLLASGHLKGNSLARAPPMAITKLLL
jgi:hypothetical protein